MYPNLGTRTKVIMKEGSMSTGKWEREPNFRSFNFNDLQIKYSCDASINLSYF